MAFEDCLMACSAVRGVGRAFRARRLQYGLKADEKLSRIRAFRILYGRGGPVAAANSSK